MEDGFLGLPLTVSGTDDTDYEIRPYRATVEGVETLWERAGRHSFLFSEFTANDREFFIQYFLQPGVLVVEAWKMDNAGTDEPVGILYADQVRPDHSARVHYFFWDKIQRTREPLILATLDWFMDQFSLHRVSIEIPWFAYSALRRVHSMNIRPEGIRRESIRGENRWSDEIIFSVLRDELSETDIKNGRLNGDHDLTEWFHLLDNEPELKQAVLKRA